MERLLERWGRLVARWPLVVVVAWIVLVVAAWRFGPSLDSVAATQHIQSLPSSAPSMRAAQLYATKFVAGQQSQNQETDILVLADPQGISDADLALAQRIEAWLTAPGTRPAHLLRVAGPGADPSGGAPATAFESPDHQALRLLLTWDTANSATLQPSIDAVVSHLSTQDTLPGGALGLTGSAPIDRDLNASVFGGASSAGNGATRAPGSAGTLIGLLIILVVLGFVYRSPLAVLAPLVSIGLALALAIPTIAWFGQTFGVPVASFSLQYVAFVMLGAGTNYGVFMLSRYREELRRAA